MLAISFQVFARVNCYTNDTNKDRSIDFVDCYGAKGQVSRKIDSNFDGIIDQFTYFHDTHIEVQEDKNNDGQIDSIRNYDFIKQVVTALESEKLDGNLNLNYSWKFSPIQSNESSNIRSKHGGCKLKQGQLNELLELDGIRDLYYHIDTSSDSHQGQNFRPLNNQGPATLNFDIEKSCHDLAGADLFEVIKISLIDGIKCLKKINTPTSLQHINKINSLLSNKRDKIKIRCSDNLKRNFYMDATLPNPKNFPEHPRVRFNKNKVSRKTGDFFSSEYLAVKNSFFHEFIHLTDVEHHHFNPKMQDYTIACDACCSSFKKGEDLDDSYIGVVKDTAEYCQLCGSPPLDDIVTREYFDLFLHKSDKNAENVINQLVKKFNGSNEFYCRLAKIAQKITLSSVSLGKLIKVLEHRLKNPDQNKLLCKSDIQKAFVRDAISIYNVEKVPEKNYSFCVLAKKAILSDGRSLKISTLKIAKYALEEHACKNHIQFLKKQIEDEDLNNLVHKILDAKKGIPELYYGLRINFSYKNILTINEGAQNNLLERRKKESPHLVPDGMIFTGKKFLQDEMDRPTKRGKGIKISELNQLYQNAVLNYEKRLAKEQHHSVYRFLSNPSQMITAKYRLYRLSFEMLKFLMDSKNGLSNKEKAKLSSFMTERLDREIKTLREFHEKSTSILYNVNRRIFIGQSKESLKSDANTRLSLLTSMYALKQKVEAISKTIHE